MSPIQQTNDESAAYNNLLKSWGSTIFLMSGMIISLLGIKIWWFKHRLNFEQNAAPNGDARGSQPVVRNNVKDKKQFQQISDSIVVHGIFRKRNEDELEVFERPRQLPQIRIPERSINTIALIPPPRTKRGNLTPEISIPMREPTSSLKETSITVENIYMEPLAIRSQISSETHSTQKQNENENEEVIEPLYGSIDKSRSKLERQFQKVSPTAAERKNFEKQSIERRATGFLSPAEAHNLDTLLVQSSEKLNVLKDSEDQSLVKELMLPTTTHVESKEVSNLEKHAPSNVVKLFLEHLESVEEVRDLENSEHITSIPVYAIANPSSKAQQTIEPFEAEKEIRQLETSESLDIVDNGFQNYDHQEFEKKRHNYQEHEGHFLELSEPLNQAQAATSPRGYGKSIDEDWENFQDLKTTTSEDELQENTAYVQSIEELYEELTDNDNDNDGDEDGEPLSNIVISHNVSTTPNKSSILKERLKDFGSSGYELPIGRAHKLKAQSKVTFDVHTEEYFLPESETDSEYEDNNNNNNYDNYINNEEEHKYKDIPKSEIPTPKQRTTKIQYDIGDIETIETDHGCKHAAPLLFGTQISEDSSESADGFDINTESCATIRQRRYESNAVEEAGLYKPIPCSSPRPAHRTFAPQQQQQQQQRRNGAEAQ